MTQSEKERLLCYAVGILGSKLANPYYTGDLCPDWLMRRSIKAANKLISTIMDDEKLQEVLENDI